MRGASRAGSSQDRAVHGYRVERSENARPRGLEIAQISRSGRRRSSIIGRAASASSDRRDREGHHVLYRGQMIGRIEEHLFGVAVELPVANPPPVLRPEGVREPRRH